MPKLVTGGSISFDEFAGSPKIQASVDISAFERRSNMTITREGSIDWNQQVSALAELFPSAPSLPGTCPAATRCYAKSCTFEPFAGNIDVPATGDIATYGKCKVVIQYESIPYDETTLISRKYSFSGEFMTLPTKGMLWSDGSAVANDELAIGKMIPITEHQITWHRVSDVPWTVIKECLGKTNSEPIDSDYFPDIDREDQLLFIGAEVSETYSVGGTIERTIEYRFSEKNIKMGDDTYNWNHFFDPVTSTWDVLYTADGDKVYKSTDQFPDLFSS